MSRKHNVKHVRSGSHYKQRLTDRGLARTPMMRWTGLDTQTIQRDLVALRSKEASKR